MKVTRVLYAFLTIVSMLPAILRASVTDFTWTPNNPVMGELVTYTPIVDDNPPFSMTSYKWEFRFLGICNTDWILAQEGMDPGVSIYETRPGTWQVRLTVTYATIFGNPPITPPPTIITKQVTIAPATGVMITEGLNAPAGVNASITLKFRLMSGNKPCGPMISGVPQELITDKWALNPPLGTPNPINDPDWTPDQPKPGVFWLQGNEIFDVKAQIFYPVIWNQIPINTTYYKMTQALRLKYVDPCGVEHIIPLGSFQFNRVKDANGDWYLTQ